MHAIDLLTNRNTASNLQDPAPSGTNLEAIFQAGLRSPDHARLRPWRFLTIDGDARLELGQLFASSLKHRNPNCNDSDLIKVRKQPLRAPLIIVVMAKLVSHPKVPETEQMLSAGCACHAMLLAAESLGFAGIWRTGVNAYDANVKKGLGLAEHESIIGYLYLGTRKAMPKPLPSMESSDFFQTWPQKLIP